MSQFIDQHIFNMWKSYHEQYAKFSKKLMQVMDACGFQLVRPPITYPNHSHQFMFVPYHASLNDLEQPFRLYCNFSSVIYYFIDQSLKVVYLKIIIHNLKTFNKSVQFYQYLHLIEKLKKQYGSLLSDIRQVDFNLQKNQIQIYFLPQTTERLIRETKIKQIYNQVKKNIIQLFVINKQHHDELTTEQMNGFQIQRFIQQRDMYSNEEKRLNKKIDNFQIKRAERKFKDNIEKSGIFQLVTCQSKKEADLDEFISKVNKNKNHRKQIQGLLNKTQNKKQFMQLQHRVTIYQHIILNGKTSVNQLQQLKESYQKYRIFQIQQKKPICICNGITILHQNQEINLKLKEFKQETFLSTVQFIDCFLRYRLSVHASTNRLQQGSENEQKMKPMKEQDSRQHKESTKNNVEGEAIERKRLVKKRCLKLGEQQFVNQYQFLKYMRNKMYPNIPLYYLQEITSNSCRQEAKSQQKFQQIISKSIYIEQYEMHLGQFLMGQRRPIFKLEKQTIVEMLFQLAATLRYLSYFRILHRDLKLNNVMLEHCVKGKYRVKFIDWGNFYMSNMKKIIYTTPDNQKTTINPRPKPKRKFT